MTCPACQTSSDAPAARVGAVGVCPACGRSIVFADDGTIRLATAADTTALTDAERTTLRKARGRTR